jgi:release factor glutamine methyltransferase
MAANLPTVAKTLADLTARFSAAGIDTARLDARVLLAHALGLEPSQLFARSDAVLAPEIGAAAETFAQRRLAHEPVSRIIGRREFWAMDFALTPDTLDPRADTETIVTAVLNQRGTYAAPRILDLGTGTGCILLAILEDWPQASGIGVDLSPGAVGVARANAARLGLASRAAFQHGNWGEGIEEQFEVIVSNPPYIAERELARLAPEVGGFDPALALNGGADGLAAYRALIPSACRRLKPGGRLFLELGLGQADSVAGFLTAAGLRPVAQHLDLSGIVRCLEAVAA